MMFKFNFSVRDREDDAQLNIPPYQEAYKHYFSQDDYSSFYQELLNLGDILEEGDDCMMLFRTLIVIGIPLTMAGMALFIAPFYIPILDKTATESAMFTMLSFGLLLTCIGPCLVMIGKDNMRLTVDEFCKDYVALCKDFEKNHERVDVRPSYETDTIAFLGKRIIHYDVHVWLLKSAKKVKRPRSSKRSNRN